MDLIRLITIYRWTHLLVLICKNKYTVQALEFYTIGCSRRGFAESALRMLGLQRRGRVLVCPTGCMAVEFAKRASPSVESYTRSSQCP